MDWRRFFKPKTPVQTPQKASGIPMLDQVMSATKGATDAFSGFGNSLIKKMGSTTFSGLVGYGIGFSHGYGFGRSSKQLQSRLDGLVEQPMTKMIGLIPGLPFGRGALPMPEPSKSAQSKVPTNQISAESMMQQATDSVDQISEGSMTQLPTKSTSQISQGLVGSQPTTKIGLASDSKALKEAAVDYASDTQTEKFPQNPSLKGDGGGLDEKVGLMQPETKLLQTVMKQRQIIDELVEENEKLCQILQGKDLKMPSSKLQASSSDSNIQTFPSSEVQDKITAGVSRPPADAGGTLSISKGENDGTLSTSKAENQGISPTSKEENDGTLPISKGENGDKKE